MFSSRTGLRATLREGGYLYSGASGTGTTTEVDLGDLGTCRTLPTSALSVQVASGSAALELYPGASCTGAATWRSGSLAQTDLPWAAWSYRVVRA
ncbi:hypothetical protein [Streptomyces justiciae]|uniref:hypothetical protein n=1 Tax=Streptomyces justiciae TaxID=2780140 RepID=UPI0021177EC5|nr:hypothetical protein [Streptomyces justiciae]MCW8383850.1 hypothetical protein [Streptomyces justiciae]